MIDKNSIIHLLAPDGKVRNIPFYLKDDLMKKGWRIIVNPKETYYPEFDSTIKRDTKVNENILNPENIERGEILEVIRI